LIVMERKRMLIFDDEPSLVRAMRREFSSDCDVRTAGSGLDALNIMAEGFRPDYILTDNDMTDVGEGTRLVRAVYLFGESAGLNVEKIVLWSGEMDDYIRSGLLDYPVVCLHKPVSNAELRRYFLG